MVDMAKYNLIRVLIYGGLVGGLKGGKDPAFVPY